MKRRVVLFTLLIAMVVAAGCMCTNQESIVGTWTGKNKDGQEIVVTFSGDGTVTVAVDDDKGDGNYQVDFSKKPMHLDIDFGSRGKVNTILQFLDGKRIQVENNDPGKLRPATFTEAAVIMTRKQ